MLWKKCLKIHFVNCFQLT